MATDDETYIIVGVLVGIVVLGITFVIAGFWIYICCEKHRNSPKYIHYQPGHSYQQSPSRIGGNESVADDQVSLRPSIAPITKKPTVRNYKQRMFASQPNLGLHEKLGHSLGRLMESEPASHYQLSLDENDELIVDQGMFELEQLEEYDAEPHFFGETKNTSAHKANQPEHLATTEITVEHNLPADLDEMNDQDDIVESSTFIEVRVLPLSLYESDSSKTSLSSNSNKGSDSNDLESMKSGSNINKEVSDNSSKGESDQDASGQDQLQNGIQPNTKTISNTSTSSSSSSTSSSSAKTSIADEHEPAEVKAGNLSTQDLKEKVSPTLSLKSLPIPNGHDKKADTGITETSSLTKVSKLKELNDLPKFSPETTVKYTPLDYPKQNVLVSGLETSDSESSLDESKEEVTQSTENSEILPQAQAVQKQNHQAPSSLASVSYKADTMATSSVSSVSDNDSEVDIVGASEAQSLEPKQAMLVKTALSNRNQEDAEVVKSFNQPAVSRKRKLTPAVPDPISLLQLRQTLAGTPKPGLGSILEEGGFAEEGGIAEEDEEYEDYDAYDENDEAHTLF